MKKTYGILALFETAADIYEAAGKVRKAGYQDWDVITPFPVHGMDSKMGLRRSRVPIFTFIGGFIGFWTGMFIAWYMGAYDYPLIVAGMPFFSPIFNFPVAFELTILFAAFGTLGGMFVTNQLPMHYHPVMEYADFHRLTDDRFAVVIEASDPRFDPEQTQAFLQGLGSSEVSLIGEEEED